MDKFTSLMNSIGPVLWPIFAILALAIFAKPIKNLLVSIVNRNVKVKIGDTEIEMGELAKQHDQLISDVVTELARRRKAMGSETEKQQVPVPNTKRVLWVDDTPLNNVSAASIISSAGFEIDQAVTTAQGLELFSKRHYDFVITDMGRKEGASYNQLAGIDLTQEIRQHDSATPILIYTTTKSVQRYGDQAIQVGATKVTTSTTDMIETMLA